MKLRIAAALVGLVALSLVDAAQAQTANNVTVLSASLADGNNVVLGAASYQSITRRGTTKTYFEVALANLTLPDATTLNVIVDGNLVATLKVKARSKGGRAGVVLASPLGATVPSVAAGDSIAIELTDHTLVASGTFKVIK